MAGAADGVSAAVGRVTGAKTWGAGEAVGSGIVDGDPSSQAVFSAMAMTVRYSKQRGILSTMRHQRNHGMTPALRLPYISTLNFAKPRPASL